jgi:hypothetical protein
VPFLHDLHEKSPKDQDDNDSSANVADQNGLGRGGVYCKRSLIFRAISGVSANEGVFLDGYDNEIFAEREMKLIVRLIAEGCSLAIPAQASHG